VFTPTIGLTRKGRHRVHYRAAGGATRTDHGISWAGMGGKAPSGGIGLGRPAVADDLFDRPRDGFATCCARPRRSRLARFAAMSFAWPRTHLRLRSANPSGRRMPHRVRAAKEESKLPEHTLSFSPLMLTLVGEFVTNLVCWRYIDISELVAAGKERRPG
jgi:hypothetical protein